MILLRVYRARLSRWGPHDRCQSRKAASEATVNPQFLSPIPLWPRPPVLSQWALISLWPQQEDIPSLLHPQVVGLYRLCGSAAVKKELRDAFERDSAAVCLSEDLYPDINVITGQQPVPLLPAPHSTLTSKPSL